MKYLVTGGAGFIGSHLVDELVDMGSKVAVIDNLFSGVQGNINPKAEFHRADVRDLQAIKPLCKGIDAVFHLAAIPRVPLSVEDPVFTWQVNVMGAINVFKAAIDGGAKRIVFASSSAVYGNAEKLPFQEDAPAEPISPYGLQKLSGEQYARLFSTMYGVPIISLRYFNVYGPRIDFDSDYSLVIGKFLRLSLQKKPLTIFGDGRQTRDFCYVKDVVSANIKAMESRKVRGGEAINIGGGESYSVNLVSELIGGEVLYLPARIGDVLHTKADISLAKELLGWEPKTGLHEGLSRTKEWFMQKTLLPHAE